MLFWNEDLENNQQSLLVSFLFPVHAFISGISLQGNLIKLLFLTKKTACRDRKRAFQQKTFSFNNEC